MEKKDLQYILKWAKKIRAINSLGGVCKKCKCDDIFCLEFHHEGNKQVDVSQILDRRWTKIEKEIEKCILLCRNCHRQYHVSSNKKYFKLSNLKYKLMEVYGSNKCFNCEYSTYFGALEFHHIKNKEFKISLELCKRKGITEKILNELDKCKLLCSNCHNKEHIDVNKFNFLKDEIYKKVNNMNEIRGSLVEDVLRMKTEGCTQTEIRKKNRLCKIYRFANMEYETVTKIDLLKI